MKFRVHDDIDVFLAGIIASVSVMPVLEGIEQVRDVIGFMALSA